MLEFRSDSANEFQTSNEIARIVDGKRFTIYIEAEDQPKTEIGTINISNPPRIAGNSSDTLRMSKGAISI